MGRRLFMRGDTERLRRGIGRGMSDHVLEDNPALERLIERLGAPGELPPREESSASTEHAKRSRRGRRSKIRAADRRESLDGEPMAGGAEHRTEEHPRAPVDMTDGEPAIVANRWASHDDPQPTDEMLLVDFDEEPEVFDEDPGYPDGDRAADEADEADDADEILDIFEDEDWDSYEDEDWGRDAVVDPGADVIAEDGHEGGDWIFEAFEAWRLEHDAGLVDASAPRP